MLNKAFPFHVLLRDMNDVRQEMNRFIGRCNPLATPATATPAVNLWEDDSHYYVEMDLPAIALDKLDVTIAEGNHLTIQGERVATEPNNAVWHRQERFHGTFAREIPLPLPVDADKVQANYEHGVLKLTLPKSEAAKPRKIVVKGE